MKLLLAMPVALTALAAAYGPQDDDEPYVPPKCTECKSTGLHACSEHRPSECELERNAIYCSHFAGCPECRGAGWVDCEDCEHEESEAWLAQRLVSQAAGEERWTEEIDGKLDFAPLKAESDHFLVAWEIESMKVDKRRLDQHELAHLHLDRFETLYTDYCEVLHCAENDFSGKTRVFVWALPNDQENGSRVFCGNEGERGVKLMGPDPVFSVCGSRQYYRGDEELHRSLIHNVTHLLFSSQHPALWIGNRKGGWADEGLAHWFEDRYFEVCDNYCYQEQNTNQDFKGGVWRPAVRKMVGKDEFPPVGEMFEQNTDTLTLEQHAVAFSYVDYLLTLDGAEANRMFRLMRSRTATRDALREVFALSPIEFEEAWSAWVLETYPRR